MTTTNGQSSQAEQIVKAAVETLQRNGLNWEKLHEEKPDLAHKILMHMISHERGH